MRIILSISIGVLIWACTGPATPVSNAWEGEWVDLTYPFNEQTILIV